MFRLQQNIFVLLQSISRYPRHETSNIQSNCLQVCTYRQHLIRKHPMENPIPETANQTLNLFNQGDSNTSVVYMHDHRFSKHSDLYFSEKKKQP